MFDLIEDALNLLELMNQPCFHAPEIALLNKFIGQ